MCASMEHAKVLHPTFHRPSLRRLVSDLPVIWFNLASPSARFLEFEIWQLDIQPFHPGDTMNVGQKVLDSVPPPILRFSFFPQF